MEGELFVSSGSLPIKALIYIYVDTEMECGNKINIYTHSQYVEVSIIIIKMHSLPCNLLLNDSAINISFKFGLVYLTVFIATNNKNM